MYKAIFMQCPYLSNVKRKPKTILVIYMELTCKTEVIDIKVRTEDNYISTTQSALETEDCR
jgi:hypothetical protein